MPDRRTQLIEIFEDTETFIRENTILAAKAAQARKETTFFPGDEYPPLPPESSRKGLIRVSKHKTFETAMALHKLHPS